MRSALTVARLAALVAILGFFMPWAEVSCSGQPLAHESGVELITGDAGSGAGAPGGRDLWVAAALALVLAGAAGSLVAGGRRAAAMLVAAAPAAAVASLIGVSQAVPSADVQAQLGAGAASGEVVRARLEYGYFVTLGGLVVAAAAAGMALGRRDGGE